jgi:hypothetical protein
MKGIKMTTRIWTKQQTQQTIKALRNAGYEVTKRNGTYETILDDVSIFRAMVGTNSYLVTYNDRLFNEGL